MESFGRVAALWRYPVKGLAAESLPVVTVESSGVAGDRQRALVVRTRAHARTGKTYRGKENNLLHLCDRFEDAVALGASRAIDLGELDEGPYFDDSPISLVLDSWIRSAEELCGLPLEPLRFRPNLYVETGGTPRYPAEADLVGRHLRAGDVELRVTKPIERCVTISFDVATGSPSREVLEAIAQRRDNVMGVYCEVLHAGSIAAGDTIFARAAL